GACGASRSRNSSKSWCSPLSSSLTKTDAVICIALTRQSPSLMPLSRRHSSTCGVMFRYARRPGTLNHSSLRKECMAVESGALRVRSEGAPGREEYRWIGPGVLRRDPFPLEHEEDPS